MRPPMPHTTLLACRSMPSTPSQCHKNSIMTAPTSHHRRSSRPTLTSGHPSHPQSALGPRHMIITATRQPTQSTTTLPTNANQAATASHIANTIPTPSRHLARQCIEALHKWHLQQSTLPQHTIDAVTAFESPNKWPYEYAYLPSPAELSVKPKMGPPNSQINRTICPRHAIIEPRALQCKALHRSCIPPCHQGHWSATKKGIYNYSHLPSSAEFPK